jgi:hypothetical protein
MLVITQASHLSSFNIVLQYFFAALHKFQGHAQHPLLFNAASCVATLSVPSTLWCTQSDTVVQQRDMEVTRVVNAVKSTYYKVRKSWIGGKVHKSYL